MELGIVLTILSPYLTAIPALAAFFKILAGKIPVYNNPLNDGLLVLFAISLISGTLNRSFLSALSSLVILLYFCITNYLQHKITDEHKAGAFLQKVWLYSLPTAVLGIVEKMASYYFDLTWIADFYLNEPITYVYRIYSTYGNPNIAGAWFAAMVLVGLHFFEAGRFQKKLYYFTGLALYLVALFFTGSRGATMALEAAFLIYAVFTKNRVVRLLLLSTIVLIAVLAFFSPELHTSHQLNARSHIWVKSFNIFKESPLLGGGTFGVSTRINKLHAHNIWLSFLALYGTAGLAAYLWLRAYVYRCLALLYRQKLPLFPLLAAVQGLIVVHGIVDFIMMSPQGGVLVLAAAAVAAGLARSLEPELQKT